MKLLAPLLLASLALAAPAAAAPRYAAPGGNGPEPCSSASPCSFANALHNAPADGGEVIVKSGNYEYGATISVTKRLDVHGVAGEPRPRILPASGFNGQAVFIAPGAGQAPVRLARLDVRSVALPVHTYADGGVFEDLILTATGSSGTALLFEGPGQSLVRNSVARGLADHSVGVVVNAGTVRLRNVTAYAAGAGSVGITAHGYCTTQPGMQMCFTGPTNPEVDVLNTIAHGDGYSLAASADPSATAKITIGHSNFASQFPASAGVTYVDAGGNQSEPPLFKTGLIGAFHERSDSPTIDAGIAEGAIGDADFDGDLRTLGAAPDIGADEFIPLVRSDPGGGDPGSGDPGSGDPGTGDPGDPGGGPPDTIVPALSDLAVAPERFRAAATGPSAAAKTGATTVFTLSEPAMVSFRVERRAAGRRNGKRCAKPTRRLRRHKRCARYVRVKGGFDRVGAAGPNGFKFSGRIGDRKLKPARYRFVAMAADAAGNLSKPARAPFRIVRR